MNYKCKLNKCPAFNSDNSTSATRGYCYFNSIKIYVDSGDVCLPEYYVTFMEHMIDQRIKNFGLHEYKEYDKFKNEQIKQTLGYK